ncbi:MAG: HlyD family efflux transporter periplasmic adaptor subunit, partial [Planctomycetota bacterium]
MVHQTPSGLPRRQGSVAVETLRVVLPLLILAAGLLVAWSSAKFKTKTKSDPEPPRVPEVVVALAAPNTAGLVFEESGSVVPFREVTLAAEVSGRIVAKADVCRSGRYVKAGTVLISIDRRDYEIEVRRLKQELRQAEVSIHEADVELENLHELIALAEEDQGLQSREVARLRPLVTGRAAAASELDRALSAEILAENKVQTLQNQAELVDTRRESLKAALELARTKLEKAELDLERTDVRAPTDGVITSEMVEADSFVQRGTPLVSLEDTSSVEVKCNLRSDYIGWFWTAKNRVGWNPTADEFSVYEIPRLPATVRLESHGEVYEWDAVLNRYDGFGLDAETRTIPTRVLVTCPTSGTCTSKPSEADGEDPSSSPALVRGMFVTVSIRVEPDRALLSIPKEALQLGDMVWVVRDGQLHRQPVEVAMEEADLAIVEGP